MKKQVINILIAAITVVMLGLIVIQFYWINNAISLRQDEFDRDVSDALEAVTEGIEREEALAKLRSSEQGNLLFRSIDTLVQQSVIGPDSSRPDYFFVQDIQQKGEQVEVRVIEERDGHRRTKVISTGAFADSSDHMNIGWDEQAHVEATESYEQAGDSTWEERFEERTAFAGEMLKSLMKVQIFESLEERLDSAKLDSMLRREFVKHGIRTDFVFAAYNSRRELVIGHRGEFREVLDQSQQYASLFPHDIVDNLSVLRVYFPRQQGYIISTLGTMLGISALLILAIIGGFGFSISTIIRQKKLSEIKTDFINNMTHELKTPISTISLACQALADPDINADNRMLGRYVGMIGDENKRLGSLVERVLQSAVLDKGDFKIKREQVLLNDLIQNVMDKTGMRVRERQGDVKLKLDAGLPPVTGDPVHLTNVIHNLLDNAIKYSPNAPDITISTHNVAGSVSLTVQDHGIGISRDNLKRVFDKLYRVPTGNVHDVKGFGLGLNYVKIIVEKHGGLVRADSKPGQGSSFTITIPTQSPEAQ